MKPRFFLTASPLFVAALLAFGTLLAPAAKKSARPAPPQTLHLKPFLRHAPNFTLEAGNTLHSLRGQPVVLLIASSPKDKTFRKQIRRLQREYAEFANRGTVFVAAFTEKSEGVIRSNVPFALARNGAQLAADLAADLGATKRRCFYVALINKEGGLDLTSQRFVAPYRLRDAIDNARQKQRREREDLR